MIKELTNLHQMDGQNNIVGMDKKIMDKIVGTPTPSKDGYKKWLALTNPMLVARLLASDFPSETNKVNGRSKIHAHKAVFQDIHKRVDCLKGGYLDYKILFNIS